MQNKLPLAKDRNAREIMPDKAALLKCFAVANTPESVDYLVVKFEQKLKRAGLFEKSEAVFARFIEHAENVRAQREDRENPYVPGENVLSDFENFQRNLCKNSLKVLRENIAGEVKIDFAVSDSSEMVRSFSVDGKALSKKEESAMDKVLNSLFADQDMVSKNSVIYKSIDGKILEESGKPVKADKDKIIKAIREDLPKILAGNELVARGQQHKFPEQAPAAKARATPAPRKPDVVEPAVDVTPESPSSGVGSGR